MNQHFLAHHLQGIFRSISALPDLQKSLEQAQAYDPIHLSPGQMLSAENVEHAQAHQERIAQAQKAVNGQQEGIRQATAKLLELLPDTIKNRIQAGTPLVAQWEADGIHPLALVYKNEAFTVRAYDRADDLLAWLRE